MAAEMERWRSFFAQAETDLWTIIDQAIVLAAADFPAEFKQKRCEIAEILFERRPCPSPPTRSMDVTMVSGSVVTNATGDGKQKVSHQTWWDEDNGIRESHTSRRDIKIADTPSQGTAPQSSLVERYSRQNDNSVEQGARLRSHNDPNAIALTDHGPTFDSSVLQNVRAMKDQIMDYTNQSDDGILRSLHALERVEITVEILKATDIGREVNKFRKHQSACVQNLAKQLVRTWKGMVDEWVKKTDPVLPLSAGEDQEAANIPITDPKRANLQKEYSAQKSLQLLKQPLKSSSMVHQSTARSHLHAEHSVEDMGSSRFEADDIYRHEREEGKVNLSGLEGHTHKCVPKKISIGSSDLRRPATRPTSEVERHRMFSSDKLALKDVKHEGEFSSPAQNLSAIDHKDLDVLKRHRPEGQLDAGAKKQRDAPPSSYPEVCKKSVLSARLPTSTRAQHSTQRR